MERIPSLNASFLLSGFVENKRIEHIKNKYLNQINSKFQWIIGSNQMDYFKEFVPFTEMSDVIAMSHCYICHFIFSNNVIWNVFDENQNWPLSRWNVMIVDCCFRFGWCYITKHQKMAFWEFTFLLKCVQSKSKFNYI